MFVSVRYILQQPKALLAYRKLTQDYYLECVWYERQHTQRKPRLEMGPVGRRCLSHLHHVRLALVQDLPGMVTATPQAVRIAKYLTDRIMAEP
jgi:hypothetical protein